MNVATYARKNLSRRRGRTILTVIAIAVTILIFSLIRTVVGAWEAGADAAATDRLATRHKVSITMQVPRRYIDEIRAVPGVTSASYANWFGAKDPKQRTPFFAGFAVDHETWFTVYDEMGLEPGVLEKFKTTRNGAVLGDVLARTLQVKVGERIVITSDIYPGDWEFEVVGIYKALRKSTDRTSFVFRWDFLNDDPRATFSHDQIGWMVTRITDASRSADISRAIDAKFEEKDDQTVTMSERAFALSFLGAFSAILNAFSFVSVAILLIMLLILANTVAMNVRERTNEYGVLRAIGFGPRWVAGFIFGEAMLIALIGGLVGVGLVYLLVNMALGPALEENMAGMFPYFRAGGGLLLRSLGLAVLIGAVSAIIPAMQASRLKVVDALRRIN